MPTAGLTWASTSAVVIREMVALENTDTIQALSKSPTENLTPPTRGVVTMSQPQVFQNSFIKRGRGGGGGEDPGTLQSFLTALN